VEACQANYNKLMLANKIIDGAAAGQRPAKTDRVRGKIEEIRSADIDGNTWFYIRLAGGEVWFTVSAKADPLSVILSVGDEVAVKYVPADGAIVEAASISRVR
jgi:hypothetical protein